MHIHVVDITISAGVKLEFQSKFTQLDASSVRGVLFHI